MTHVWASPKRSRSLGERERLAELIDAARADYAASGTQHPERDATLEATATRLLGER